MTEYIIIFSGLINVTDLVDVSESLTNSLCLIVLSLETLINKKAANIHFKILNTKKEITSSSVSFTLHSFPNGESPLSASNDMLSRL